MSGPRPEYPRPQFRRAEWQSLNGRWRFAFDDADMGLTAQWQSVSVQTLGATGGGPFDREIMVPFAYQAPLSGIGDRSFHDVCWYARSFDAPRVAGAEGLLLHFGAVDYRARVWVNGQLVSKHEGGHTPFSADISGVVRAHDNVLVVRVEDPSEDLTIPRGKQYWKEKSEHIFYTRTTGIWQTVWLEPVPAARIDTLRLTPDFDAAAIYLEVGLSGSRPGTRLNVTVTHEGMAVAEARLEGAADTVEHALRLAAAGGLPLLPWSPESPSLYDLCLELVNADGGRVDRVESYFGVRKIEARGGDVYLNDRPYYQRLVLDQGYFPQGILTAPSDADLRRDIELAKAMGFNGARKHQKVEDPRWLYWADRLGFIVWGEMANAYQFSVAYARRMLREWHDVIVRDYNHPCIVAWVPINESSGIRRNPLAEPQVDHLLALYHVTRSLDRTRLVVSNDGWEQARTDLCTIHDYSDPAQLLHRFATPRTSLEWPDGAQAAYCPGHQFSGEPILVTEFGGIAFGSEAQGAWGYTTVRDETQFLAQYAATVDALLQSRCVRGFCYTQLTDVEQEVNGLLTADRQPKAELARIRAITAQDLIEQPLAA